MYRAFAEGGGSVLPAAAQDLLDAFSYMFGIDARFDCPNHRSSDGR